MPAFRHYLTAFLGACAAAAMAAPAHSETLQFEGATWEIADSEDSEARIGEFLGREALYLSHAHAALKGEDLRDVVIEYDYAATHPSGFMGVDFRADPEGTNLERFYTRHHQSGQPDATQYMVMVNGLSTWQLHAGPNEAVATDLPAREWIKVRIVAIGDKADIFVGDMSTPLIHVPDLRNDAGAGRVSLYADDRFWVKGTGTWFSNISIRPATPGDTLIGTPAGTEPAPAGLLTAFAVSQPFPEAEMEDRYALNGLDALNGDWVTLPVENDGVANLARTTPLSDGNDTVLVRFTVTAEEATHRMLNFGYSDRVRLFANGKLVYAGNAGWRSRDHRFLGTVALEDSIALNLKEGDNEIVAAVSESFGGWGFKAQLENQDGLTVSVD